MTEENDNYTVICVLQPRPGLTCYNTPVRVIDISGGGVTWLTEAGIEVQGSIRYATRYWVVEDHDVFWNN